MERRTSNQPIRTYEFDALPDEVWTEIIRYYTSSHIDDFPYIDLDLLLPLMNVSTNWAQIIQGTPTFWTDLVISDLIEDLEMKITMCLAFSMGAPLSLHLPYPDESWKVVAPLILPVRPRIYTVSMPPYIEDTPVTTLIMMQLLPLENLRRLTGPRHSLYRLVETFFAHHEYITDLRGFQVSIEMLRIYQPRLKTLRMFMEAEPATIFPPLVNIKTLKDVEILHPTGYLTTEYSFPPHCSLGWTSLWYEWDDGRLHLMLMNQLQHSLVYLSVSLSIESLVNYLAFVLPLLEQLHTLEIRLTNGQYKPRLKPPDPNNKCRARTLKVTFPDFGYDDTLEDVQVACKLMRSMMSFVEIVHILVTESNHVVAFFEDKGFERAHSLTVDWSGSPPESSELSLHMPPLIFSMHLRAPGAVIPLFPSNSVQIVKFEQRPQSSMDSSDLNQWVNLRSLTLEYISTSFQRVSLPLLTSLEIHPGGWPGYSDAATAFCHMLALFPRHCPSLESLKLDLCPEWDIFLIMLETRNFLDATSVSPIRYIMLPARCPPYIRSMTMHRVQGRKSSRPSNFELSLEANREGIEDLEVPGCLACHLALVYCERAVGKNLNARFQKPRVSKISRYPETTDGVVSTWQERRESWNPLKMYTRDRTCMKDAGPSHNISEYSLEDPTFENVDKR